MKELHLTQKALAERMNCTQQYVSKILKGKENLSLDTMTRLEEVLEISLVYPEVNAFLPSQVAEEVYVLNKHPQTSDSSRSSGASGARSCCELAGELMFADEAFKRIGEPSLLFLVPVPESL